MPVKVMPVPEYNNGKLTDNSLRQMIEWWKQFETLGYDVIVSRACISIAEEVLEARKFNRTPVYSLKVHLPENGNY